MSTPRRIAVVTGTRADYGLLRWLMADIAATADLELSVIATGSHLSEAFGMTVDAIEADGFAVDERVPILDEGDDSALAVARATGRAVTGIAEALDRQHPDLVVLLGDRYEILAAAQAALIIGIPVAHLHGGELTEGAFDDAIRHAITKLSHLHFPSAEPYARRIVQLGEDPRHVHEVGAAGLDNFERLALLDRADLAESLGIVLDERPLIVCTFHPETLADQSPADALAPLFLALDDGDAQVIFTKANADTGGLEINRLVDAYVALHSERMWAFASLGQLRYLSALVVADVVLGNSSSGIIEAPAAGTPTVNIGDRQKGRLRAPSVVDVPNNATAIREAVATALTPEAQTLAAERHSPYGTTGAAARIVDMLSRVDLASLRTKPFHDLPG